MRDVSVIIPVYKSTDSLVIIMSELSEVFKQSNMSYEIVFVNDSPYFIPTSIVLSEIQIRNRDIVKVIKMRKNYGQQFALIVGLSHAKGKYVVTMDDDLQHPPSEIIKMLEFIEEKKIDALLAIPKRGKKKHNWFRNLGSRLISLIDSLFLDTPMGIIKSPLRVIRYDIVNSMVRNFNSTPAVSSLLFQITHNVENIIVEHHPRKFGKSNYSFIKLIGLFLNNIIHYSSFPLKMLGICGLIVFLLSTVSCFYSN